MQTEWILSRSAIFGQVAPNAKRQLSIRSSGTQTIARLADLARALT